MSEPWFNPETFARLWLLGAFGFACLCAVWGTVASYLIKRAKARRFVLGVYVGFIVVSLIVLCVGCVAHLVRQPWVITTGFLMAGLTGTVGFARVLVIVRRRYIEPEMRKSQAADL
jgi:ABC-type spermidine/putrescine transport system permease subunit II